MPDFVDTYLTPEQIAERLQVVITTVYRWLRSGKLRGGLISPKAWRVSQRELDAFIMRQNISELLFEEYLSNAGYADVVREPLIPGRSSRLDYRLGFNGQPLWFEVKEFAETEIGPGGAYDPYIKIRNRIGKAAKQFGEYQGESCSIVFYNDRLNLAAIYSPETVLGAMLGNISIRVRVNVETGQEVGLTTTGFSEGGKLIHPNLKVPQNTTISAVIALERLTVGSREFRVAVAEKEAAENRQLPWPEFLDWLQSDREKHERQVLRTLVYENPYAKVPLPKEIFRGAYDERWGMLDDSEHIGRVYTGPELFKLEESERQFDLHLGPLQKAVKKGPGKRRAM
jgi:excisionase family DNA binding protein